MKDTFLLPVNQGEAVLESSTLEFISGSEKLPYVEARQKLILAALDVCSVIHGAGPWDLPAIVLRASANALRIPEAEFQRVLRTVDRYAEQRAGCVNLKAIPAELVPMTWGGRATV